MNSTPATAAAIALGSNLGDRAANLEAALLRIGGIPFTRLAARSGFYETAPVGPVAQGPFLNAAAAVSTSLTPRQLLEALHAIERDCGRERSRETRWGPRTLDLDLLLFGDSRIDEPGLTIPHPRLHERSFVLIPLREIAPEWTVPGLGRTIRALAEAALAGRTPEAAGVRCFRHPPPGQ